MAGAKPRLNVALRGHIRLSLGDDRLRDLLSDISDRFDLAVYAHTWNVVQSSVSWRKLEEIRDKVDSGMVLDYLSGFNVKFISVEDDSTIKHVGNTEGNIGRTNCKVLGWKNMYWGKMGVVGAVHREEAPQSPTISMRFDILSNPFPPKREELLEFVDREYAVLAGDPGDERIRFLHMRCFMGVDNVYMAKTEDMLRFLNYMYYDMDRILHFHRGTIHQEHIAFNERKSWWNWKLPGEPVG